MFLYLYWWFYLSCLDWGPLTLQAARWVCGYQQWLTPEPGGYAFRERNSITGKWPVIETIPGIPKPTLHQCCSWHQLAFHYYCLLLSMLMPSAMHPSDISFHWWVVMWHVQRSPEFQSVHGQLLSLSPLSLTVHRCMKTLDSGHHMLGGHTWVGIGGQVATSLCDQTTGNI